uniref:Uncharacterized protein n=1 Tax=Lepeophtheirus salmonis TaxID=72036 RepID=A0A0K2TH16_LEPSM
MLALTKRESLLTIFSCLIVLLTLCVLQSDAGPIDDVEDYVNSKCVSSNQCHFFEYCDIMSFKCRFTDWFIALIIGLPIAVIAGICVCCLCCPFCCLYSMFC